MIRYATGESYCFLYDTRRPEWMAYLDKKRRGPRDHKITSLIDLIRPRPRSRSDHGSP